MAGSSEKKWREVKKQEKAGSKKARKGGKLKGKKRREVEREGELAPLRMEGVVNSLKRFPSPSRDGGEESWSEISSRVKDSHTVESISSTEASDH